MKDITQLPWIMNGSNYFVPEGRHDYIAWVHIDDGKVVCETQGGTPEESKANAAFIVRACNNHEALLDALIKIAAFDDTSASEFLGRTGSYSCFDEPGSVKIARAAIANAEKDLKSSQRQNSKTQSRRG